MLQYTMPALPVQVSPPPAGVNVAPHGGSGWHYFFGVSTILE